MYDLILHSAAGHRTAQESRAPRQATTNNGAADHAARQVQKHRNAPTQHTKRTPGPSDKRPQAAGKSTGHQAAQKGRQSTAQGTNADMLAQHSAEAHKRHHNTKHEYQQATHRRQHSKAKQHRAQQRGTKTRGDKSQAKVRRAETSHTAQGNKTHRGRTHRQAAQRNTPTPSSRADPGEKAHRRKKP